MVVKLDKYLRENSHLLFPCYPLQPGALPRRCLDMRVQNLVQRDAYRRPTAILGDEQPAE